MTDVFWLFSICGQCCFVRFMDSSVQHIGSKSEPDDKWKHEKSQGQYLIEARHTLPESSEQCEINEVYTCGQQRRIFPLYKSDIFVSFHLSCSLSSLQTLLRLLTPTPTTKAHHHHRNNRRNNRHNNRHRTNTCKASSKVHHPQLTIRYG